MLAGLGAATVAALALALVVGAVMGLTGAGGSILTVPILVYVVGVDAVTATAYSLFVVGVTSAVGAASYWRRGLVHTRAAVAFAIPSLIAVFLTRRFLLPAIPDRLGTVAGLAVSKELFILLLFAVIMALSAVAMIIPPRHPRAKVDRAGVSRGAGRGSGNDAGLSSDASSGAGSGPGSDAGLASHAGVGSGLGSGAGPGSGAGVGPRSGPGTGLGSGAGLGSDAGSGPRSGGGLGSGAGATGSIRISVPLAAVEGALIGVFTGIVGAGGGFAIVPALAVYVRLPMRVAVGTSLTIIAAKSLIGFLGDVTLPGTFDWPLLVAFSALAVVGILAGSRLGHLIPGTKLRAAFGWFVLAAAAAILLRELLTGVAS